MMIRAVLTFAIVASTLVAADAVSARAANVASSAASPLVHDRRAHDVLTADCEDIFADVRTEAKRGNVASLEMLAESYFRGECGVGQDQRRAGAIYKKILSLRPSDPAANGFLSLYGDGRPESAKKAIAYYTLAQREHDPFAPLGLYDALSSSSDHAVQRQALRWARVASDEGDLLAKVILADAYIYGFGEVAIDRPRGLDMLRKADLANSGQAARELGIVYRDGVGVPVDKRQAETYFKRSVQLGNVFAGLLLACDYADTENAQAARAESLAYAEGAKARLYDNPDAIADIGFIYMSEVGVPADFPKAARLLQQAVDGGSTMAMDNLSYLKLNGLGTPADFSGGVHLLLRSAAHGDTFAKTQLSILQIRADQNARVSEANMEAAQAYWRMTMQRQAMQNQLPNPNSPAYQMIHPQEPEPEPEYGEGGGQQ